MNRIDFFKYHAGNGKYLSLWFGLIDANNESITIKQFIKLSSGIRFSLNGSDKLYELAKDTVLTIK